MTEGRGRPRKARCPICRGPLPDVEESPERGPKFAPLCSMRCKRIDLATWLGEGYRVPGPPADPEMIEGAMPRTGEEEA
ncbi:MAG: DNA gyrase inhibitor YacG [Sandaracinus sp.]